VSNLPFGFNPGHGDDDDGPGNGGGGSDPFAALFGGGNPGDIGAAFQRLGQLLSWQGGPVNWDLARDLARQAVSAAGDHSVSAVERDEVLDAMRLAELWLDPVTAFAAGVTSANAWSRAEWVEQTLAAWRELVDPVAGRVVDAMATLMQGEGGPLGQLGELGGLGGLGQSPEQLQALTGPGGPLQQMMTSMGGAMFGAQIGQAIGGLAVEVVGSTDIGLPLTATGRAALLPANIAVFGEGIEVPADQVRLYLALREAAHHRLFTHVPWLRAHLVDAVGAYARGIKVDTTQLEEAMGRIDPTNPEALQEALSGGLFEPQDTPEQRAALARLETALALVEGWVDEVVDAAATAHLPAAAPLRETVRRRRASGGPAEQTFASLVGLELRPRRCREAATLWRAVLDAHGAEQRDAIWAHPDLMPSAEDLDHPELFTAGLRDVGAPLDLSGLDDPDLPAAPPESTD
jgi:putative hydrolase